ncbi:MAG: LacI family DNA-binding transcriptional regulator [Gemmatimonadaceae bacterium]
MTDADVHTIADIARLAGVSKSTVSRALNDSPLIGEGTKQRIRSIAAEHEFQLNVPARRLSLKVSNTIAFVTYAYKTDFSIPDVFMLEIMSGISRALHAHGYDLLVVHVDPSDTRWPRQYLDTGRVDGFIVLSATCTTQHMTALRQMNAPFAMWGIPAGTSGFCAVTGDNFAGGKAATEHLLRSGREHIAFLGGPAKADEVKDRYRGYEAALLEAGAELDPALVVNADYTPASAAAAMRRLLAESPGVDAVFVNSDIMAISAMDAIREAGRTVPDDVAVVGYDDISIAQHSNPPLTTIRQNAPLAGKLLADGLVQYLQTGVVSVVSIPAELVVRDSA